MHSKALKARGLVSFLIFLSFLTMTITGIILYLTPQGRIAYWVNWKLLGLGKGEWEAIHLFTSLLFIITGIFHLVYNWKPFINYIRDKATGASKLKTEMAVSLIIMLAIIIFAILDLPPLSYIVDIGDTVKASWIINEDYEPPMGHAELLSFEEFTTKTKIDPGIALAELEENGIVIDDTQASLGDIAAANGTSPMEIYLLIKQFKPPPQEKKEP